MPLPADDLVVLVCNPFVPHLDSFSLGLDAPVKVFLERRHSRRNATADEHGHEMSTDDPGDDVHRVEKSVEGQVEIGKVEERRGAGHAFGSLRVDLAVVDQLSRSAMSVLKDALVRARKRSLVVGEGCVSTELLSIAAVAVRLKSKTFQNKKGKECKVNISVKNQRIVLKGVQGKQAPHAVSVADLDVAFDASPLG